MLAKAAVLRLSFLCGWQQQRDREVEKMITEVWSDGNTRTTSDVTVCLSAASFNPMSGAWFGESVYCEPRVISGADKVPDEVLIWECMDCGSRYYDAKPPHHCDWCQGSRYKPLRLIVEDG